MLTEMRAATVARPKRREGKEPATVPVKIDRVLARKARVVASDRGVSLSDYVSECLRGAVERDWGKIVRRIGEGGN